MGKARRKKEAAENNSKEIRSAALPRTPRLPAYGWLIPLLLALLVNIGVLFNGYAWEDDTSVASFSDQKPRFDSPAVTSDPYFRPLIDWSRRLDYWMWGPAPFGFHFTVYLAHAMTVLLVYRLVNLLTQFYRKDSGIALITASLFAVHPIHVEAVAWINGRSDVFMALFMMLAFYAYLRYRQGAPTGITLPLFVLGCVMGLLTKETAIPFIMLFFPALYFLLPSSAVVHPRRMRDPFIWAWIAVLAGFIVFRLVHIELPAPSAEGGGSFLTKLITLLLAWGYYLKMMLLPHPLNLLTPAPTIGDAQGAIDLVIGTVGVVGLLWIIARRRRTLWAIGAVWWAAGLAAPLIVPLVKVSATPVAERYAYLASGGFLLMIAAGIVEGWSRVEEHRTGQRRLKWIIGFVGLLAGLFSLLTIHRNTVWQDAATLWEDTVRQSPIAALPHNNLGVIYSDRKRWNDAAREFQTAVQLKPDYFIAHYNLGDVYEQNHRWPDALRAYQTALTLRPDFVPVRFNLGNVRAALGQFPAATQEYQIFLAHQPNHALAHMNLGNVYAAQRHFDRAVQEYQTAIRLQPNFAQAYYNLGMAYSEQGRPEDAIDAQSKALKIQPDFVDAYLTLGNVYVTEKRLDDAMDAYSKALKLKPGDAEAHNDLGIVYLQQTRYEEASQQFKAAINLQPNHIGARNNLGVIYARTDRLDQAVIEFEAALKYNPTNFEVMTSLGMALLREGHPIEAKKEFEKALQIRPDFLPARQALNSMRR
ncbi:MAG TPA: tetratricopeptide repeat protein [Nitrospiria bacterium]|nr:tetratricopeptide repeat protein [Nitrospiria bacterium]